MLVIYEYTNQQGGVQYGTSSCHEFSRWTGLLLWVLDGTREEGEHRDSHQCQLISADADRANQSAGKDRNFHRTIFWTLHLTLDMVHICGVLPHVVPSSKSCFAWDLEEGRKSRKDVNHFVPSPCVTTVGQD